jgi:hypothetical protein
MDSRESLTKLLLRHKKENARSVFGAEEPMENLPEFSQKAGAQIPVEVRYRRSPHAGLPD